MKKYTILLTVFLLVSEEIPAQKMVVKTYLERIHSGYKVGSAIGHETYWQIEYGVFYQKAPNGQNSESQILVGAGAEFEKEFMGVYAAIPVLYSDEVDFKVQVRTGVINGVNFVTTPSLLAHYKVADQMKLGFGIGFRALIPTIQTSFSFNF
ncbi:MAG: hypothetical protein ABJG78_03300 [Cyclobacteriaceae bacterium]